MQDIALRLHSTKEQKEKMKIREALFAGIGIPNWGVM